MMARLLRTLDRFEDSPVVAALGAASLFALLFAGLWLTELLT